MPRLLNDKPCELTLFDRISESKITLFYDLPATEDRVAYSNSIFVRRGNKIENNTGTTRLKYGAKILRGFKDGAFDKEEGKPLSSDLKSPHYDPEWKKIVRQHASDIIEALAIHVFESSLIADMPDAEEEGEEEPKDPL